MRNLNIEEVSEMIFRYMKDNQVDLLTAFTQVDDVLKDINRFEFEDIKHYLFKNT